MLDEDPFLLSDQLPVSQRWKISVSSRLIGEGHRMFILPRPCRISVLRCREEISKRIEDSVLPCFASDVTGKGKWMPPGGQRSLQPHLLRRYAAAEERGIPSKKVEPHARLRCGPACFGEIRCILSEFQRFRPVSSAAHSRL